MGKYWKYKITHQDHPTTIKWQIEQKSAKILMNGDYGMNLGALRLIITPVIVLTAAAALSLSLIPPSLAKSKDLRKAIHFVKRERERERERESEGE